MLYSYFTQKGIFMYFLEAKNPCFLRKNCSKSSYICVFISSKKPRNRFYENLHNSRMVSRRKLPDLSLNCIFNALSIYVQYTLSFQWTNFVLKCLSQENTGTKVSFLIKLQIYGIQIYQKRGFLWSFYHESFLVNSAKFLTTSFLKNPSDGRFGINTRSVFFPSTTFLRLHLQTGSKSELNI